MKVTWTSVIFILKIDPKTVAEFQDFVKRNKKEAVKMVQYQRAASLPPVEVLQQLKEVRPSAALFSIIPKLDPDDTDTVSEDEDEFNLPEPLTSLLCEDYSDLEAAERQQKCNEVYNQVSIADGQCEELQRSTQNQAISPLWFELRNGRVMAS